MEDVRCGGEDLLTSRKNVKIANLHDVFHDEKINLNKSVPEGKGGGVKIVKRINQINIISRVPLSLTSHLTISRANLEISPYLIMMRVGSTFASKTTIASL